MTRTAVDRSAPKQRRGRASLGNSQDSPLARALRETRTVRTPKPRLAIALAAVAGLAPTIAGCGSDDTADLRQGGDPDDVGEVSSAVFSGDSSAAEVIARAKYWFDEGQAGHLGKYTNSYCPIDGTNADGGEDAHCHRDEEGDGTYPSTHFYRRDCSGMASMALHMGHSTNTAGFRNGAFDFYQLADDADAKPGDLVLSTPKSSNDSECGNHTIIFEKWITVGVSWKGYSGGMMPPSHGTYYVSNDGSNMDKNDSSCNRVFHAWRSPHVIQDGTGGSGTGGASTGDSGTGGSGTGGWDTGGSSIGGSADDDATSTSNTTAGTGGSAANLDGPAEDSAQDSSGNCSVAAGALDRGGPHAMWLILAGLCAAVRRRRSRAAAPRPSEPQPGAQGRRWYARAARAPWRSATTTCPVPASPAR
jgi:ribosomal protein L24E